MPQPAAPVPPTLRHALLARNAVFAVFAVNGLGFASWMARIPQVRDELELAPSDLGRLLLAMAAGAVVALPTAGFVVGLLGSSRTIALAGTVFGGGLVLAALGAGPLDSVPATAIGLVAVGYGNGSWDVAMNVEGAAVERRLGRNIMPHFHAAWSLGTVAGAGLGAAVTWWGTSVAVHLPLVSATVVTVALVSIRFFLPRPDATGVDAPNPAGAVLRAWREPRTLLLGVVVLCFALLEGIANDWLAVGIVDGYAVDNAVGSAGFALFVTAMTLGRLSGPILLRRYGRAPIVRYGGILAATGAALVVFGEVLPVAAIGILFWGLGTALGFPIGMSAAADEPGTAAARVSVVSSIGYTAFLAGPPILGWIGDHQGVIRSLLVAVVAGVIGSVLAAATADRRPAAPGG